MTSFHTRNQVAELNRQLEKLEQKYEKDRRSIDANGDWSAEAKKRMTAELWHEHKQSWAKAVKSKRELLKRSLLTAQQRAFAKDMNDPMVRMSYRDAYARVSDKTDRRELVEILERSQAVGDEDMVRALTLRAAELEMPDLVELTFEGRDADRRKYTEMIEVAELVQSEVNDWGAMSEEPLSGPEDYRYSEGDALEDNLTRAMRTA